MRFQFMFILVFITLNFNQIYTIENNEIEGLLLIAKKIALFTKEGKLKECLSLCNKNSIAYNDTLNRINYYKSNKDKYNSLIDDAKKSNFYFIKKIFKINNDEGIIVLVIDKNSYITSVFWVFKKVNGKYYLDNYIGLDNLNL